jgi:hypothetical protein
VSEFFLKDWGQNDWVVGKVKVENQDSS